MIVPTLCVTLGLALRSRKPPESLCDLFPKSSLDIAQSARRVRLGRFFYNRGGRNAADQREQGSTGTVPGVGLSMMCYTEGKEKRTCFGECQPNGRMGKLL